MKRLRRLLISLMITALMAAGMPMTAFAKPDWPSDTGIESEAGIVMDADSGAVLFGQNIHVQKAPASITKILTALVVIENSSLDDTVTFSHDAVYNVEDGSGNKNAIEEGDTLSVRDCLYLLLMRSSNQAANALAEHVGGSRDGFVKMMNEKTAELGCENSHFANPSGLNDDTQLTSVYDMALIASAAYKNDTLLTISKDKSYRLPATKNNPDGVTIQPEHKLLITTDTESPNYYPYAVAGKTGYTSVAGQTLVTYAIKDDRRQIAVTMKSTQATHYQDTIALLDFGFLRFENVNISENETAYTSGDQPVQIGDNSYQPSDLSMDTSAVITIPKDASFADAEKTVVTDLPEDAEISFYRQGDFTDLCAGPHMMNTKGVGKAFKLMNLAGAYWRGSEKNKMLTRIYATAFATKEDLEAYITMMEEAKKRDHRKLGKELGLFMMHDAGPGFPFFLPKGMVLKNTLLDYWREIHKKAGYVEISTPIILNRKLWETSGHWDHYKNNMYTTVIDEEDYAIKPMNCPGGVLVYASEPRSYRDLPLRMGELGIVHRHEKSGQLHGLMRVRCFTQDDAHIFMTPEQIKDEIKGVVHLINQVYSLFGFKYHVELSTRPEDSMGSDEDWEMATEGLRSALEELGLPYVVNEGDGAFYGPKIDFHLEDSIGRTWQCGTIQLDFQLPQRFELEYTGADGEKHRPIMIHRVVFGSIERFIGILIEHFAGAFPTWLAPVQVKILPISDKYADYSKEVLDKLTEAGIRAEMDTRSEKIGYKIREAQTQKIPYMLVVGQKEEEEKTVSVRSRFAGDEGASSVESFIESIQKEIEEKNLRETVKADEAK
jgi:threonyl-tRNA synthetase